MILFFDIEFTCNEDSLKTNWANPKYPPEIIEIGLLIYEKGNIIDSYENFVKPSINPTLSSYCKKLTGINQIEIDNSLFLSQINLEITSWLSKYNISSAYSWGKEDIIFWENDSSIQNSKCPIEMNIYVDLMSFSASKLKLNNSIIDRKSVRELLNLSESNLHNHKAISDAIDLISLYNGITSYNS